LIFCSQQRASSSSFPGVSLLLLLLVFVGAASILDGLCQAQIRGI